VLRATIQDGRTEGASPAIRQRSMLRRCGVHRTRRSIVRHVTVMSILQNCLIPISFRPWIVEPATQTNIRSSVKAYMGAQ
jgi:hypothetical protein